jgi:thymidine phosphorylase
MLGPLSFDVPAPCSGVVTGIDNLALARIARLAGAPKVKNAGVDLLRKLGDTVVEGEPLYRVYAAFGADLGFARTACSRSIGYTVGHAGDVPRVFVEF